VWRRGFASGALVAQLFRDVPDALAEWRNAGIKVYIYSSGSREAQRQFFGHTQVRPRARARACRWRAGGPRSPHPTCPPADPTVRPGRRPRPPSPRPPARPLPRPRKVGDMRPYLCGFFDTTSGPKGEAASYKEIAASLGVDPAEQEVVFATDVLPEAQAAAAAGWKPVLVVREGNKPLAAGHGFRVVESMQQLLDE
jgi:methionine salvage enolase-phosphatase E1